MPVQLAGTTVKRASLHNFEEIERLKINIGDKVVIKKAAEIIPKVIKKASTEDRGIYEAPKTCPCCGTELKKETVALYCPNEENCPAQTKGKIEFWCSKEGMDIDGFGEAIIDDAVNKGIIKDITDIYKLTEDKLMQLDLIKEKSAQNLLKAINDSKNSTLKRFLTSLSIKLVGKETADILANEFETLENVMKATKEDFLKIDGIGEKVAESIETFFGKEKNKDLIRNLQELGIKLQKTENTKISSKLENKTFVITGTLSKPRTEIETIIKSMGGKTSSSVSKKTTYLICGENPGSKFDKATQLGVIILTESKFKEMVEGNE
jgi:DNA ligase (NAD+)